MPEIKFRAWDGERMWNVTQIDWRTPKQGSKIFFMRGVYGDEELPIGGHADFIDISKIKLLQYINRKDKRGKEIYVGDILKRNVVWQDEPIIYVVEQGEITFDSGMYEYVGFGFRVISGGYRKGKYSENEFMSCDTDDSVIIGNIHKNPELLKEEKNDGSELSAD